MSQVTILKKNKKMLALTQKNVNTPNSNREKGQPMTIEIGRYVLTFSYFRLVLEIIKTGKKQCLFGKVFMQVHSYRSVFT